MSDSLHKERHVPMPRLSSALYYERYRFLRTAWLEFDSLYTVLLVHQQWELHAYYQPSKQLTQAELLEHRRVITAKQPSLAAKAGKHFDLLYRCFRMAYAAAAGDEKKFRNSISRLSRQRVTDSVGDRRVRVRALARPEPDIKMLARALIRLNNQLASTEGRETL